MSINTLTPEDIAEKQISGARNNIDNWEKGVMRTKKSWQSRTKAAIGKMKQNINRAIDNGDVAAGIDNLSDAEMKNITVSKGKDRIGPGLDLAKGTIVDFHQQLAEHLNRTQGAIDAMPTLTDADTDRKMLANKARMKQFKFRKRLKR